MIKELKKIILLSLCISCSLLVSGQIQWLSSYSQAKEIAKKQNKLIVVDCWANWCGPCKRMDKDVWDDEAMNVYAAKYVFVKLDLSVDFNNPDFMVKAIPKIFITDAWNEQFENMTGYQSKSRMENLLKAYSYSVNDIYKAKIDFEKNNNVEKAVKLAMCYQESSFAKDIKITKVLKNKSNACFKKAEKLLKKSKNDDLFQKVQLLSCLNKSPKKSLKIMNSCKPKSEENVNLKDAILAKVYFDLEDVEKAKEYYMKVKDYSLPYYDFLGGYRKDLN
ncbi:thioredoxin fold domain-containing protein [Marinifilum sp. N1E240]|uniref:thioredoxin family protein n=1 Tax=Marinifilum sp. N1E240 TaxID=2608082 RepID=UPI00128D99A3|nr:thioredoxin family protein [Marinifilum sp. N1E240]MPQ47958.1 thioredoxin fold domain-containing protein [Marinifilum sp. N1E240]